MCVYGERACLYHTLSVEAEEQLARGEESLLPLGDQTEALSLGDTHLYPLNHLTSPRK